MLTFPYLVFTVLVEWSRTSPFGDEMSSSRGKQWHRKNREEEINFKKLKEKRGKPPQQAYVGIVDRQKMGAKR